ncbi:STAS domain-containing protein [Lentzea sp. NPDC034063]|uniref:STAS domain-containing protein n=1 Tax=unclassified Lentzea TaxID=2643253 RepID=UPI0033F721C4
MGRAAPHQVRFAGTIDAESLPDLVERVRRVPIGTDVELDLSEVRHLGAAGLAVLVRLRRQRARGGATLSVTGVHPADRRLVALVGLPESPPPERASRIAP